MGASWAAGRDRWRPATQGDGRRCSAPRAGAGGAPPAGRGCAARARRGLRLCSSLGGASVQILGALPRAHGAQRGGLGPLGAAGRASGWEAPSLRGAGRRRIERLKRLGAPARRAGGARAAGSAVDGCWGCEARAARQAYAAWEQARGGGAGPAGARAGDHASLAPRAAGAAQRFPSGPPPCATGRVALLSRAGKTSVGQCRRGEGRLISSIRAAPGGARARARGPPAIPRRARGAWRRGARNVS
jgi:hypothetical protein